MASIKIFIFCSSLAMTIALGFFLPYPIISYFFRNFSYYFIFVLFGSWLYFSIKILRGRLKQEIRNLIFPLTIALIITGLVFSLSPPRFKTLTDEANLIGISKMMHEVKIVGIPVDGIYTDYGKTDYTIVDPKRPLFFPFLVSLLHAIKGYSPNNGFILNFIVSIAILTSFFRITSKWLSEEYGYIGILLIISCPIYAFFITSSGFEALNVLFLILTFISIHIYININQTEDKLSLFLATALLLAQCRYESIIFIITIGICMIPFFIRNKFYQYFSYFACLAPILALPIIWQRMLHIGKSEINKIGSETFHILHSPFSAKYFYDNIDENLFVLLGLNSNFGYVFPVSIMAIFGAYVLIRKTILKQPTPIHPLIIKIGLICFVSLLIIVSFFYWGRFTIPVDIRLSFILLPFVGISAIAGIYFVRKVSFLDKPLAIFIIIIFVTLYYLPVASQQSVIRIPSLPYEYEQVLKVLKDRYPSKGYTLIISEFPNLYTIQNYSSIPFSNKQKISEYVYKKSLFDRILIIQHYDKKSGMVSQKTQLPISLKKYIVEEISLSPTTGVRISKIVI